MKKHRLRVVSGKRTVRLTTVEKNYFTALRAFILHSSIGLGLHILNLHLYLKALAHCSESLIKTALILLFLIREAVLIVLMGLYRQLLMYP